jgi:osmotically-inducible protein OsmY
MKMKTAPMRLVKLLAWLAFASAGLQGCAPMLVGGFVGGTMVVSDRRSSGTQLEDEAIELKTSSRIKENLGDKANANVSSYNRQVLITGEVANARDKEFATQIASQVDNVKAVLNELQIIPFKTYTDRGKNILLATRVKANLVDTRDLSANAFKIAAEDGTIYLMGRVTKREADLAVEVVRNTPGVQKVIKVFETLTEDELRALLPAPKK